MNPKVRHWRVSHSVYVRWCCSQRLKTLLQKGQKAFNVDLIDLPFLRHLSQLIAFSRVFFFLGFSFAVDSSDSGSKSLSSISQHSWEGSSDDVDSRWPDIFFSWRSEPYELAYIVALVPENTGQCPVPENNSEKTWTGHRCDFFIEKAKIGGSLQLLLSLAKFVFWFYEACLLLTGGRFSSELGLIIVVLT